MAGGKIDRVMPLMRKAAATGRSQVVAIGVAQEYQRMFTGTKDQTPTGAVWFSYNRTERRVTCYYFYLWDEGFGPAFIKICAYFPYPGKIWVNGHEWAKRQAARAGLSFRELSNGFAACEDPAALQQICDRLGPGPIRVFAERPLERRGDLMSWCLGRVGNKEGAERSAWRLEERPGRTASVLWPTSATGA